MANFSIALCILLVACGAQGATVRGDESEVNVRVDVLEMMEELSARIKSEVQKMTKAIEDAVAKVTDFNERVTSAVENQIEEFKANLKELSTNVQGVNSCISRRIDLKDLAKDIASNSIRCTLEVLRSLRAQYAELKAAFEELANKLRNVKAQIEECSENTNMWGSLKCRASVWKSEINDIGSSFMDLVKKTGLLVIRISRIESELAACGGRSALETLQRRLSSAAPEIMECISNL